MREGAGMLLKELMRIKAEGDYAAIKALVDQYGVRFDPKVRDQVVAARNKALSSRLTGAGINPCCHGRVRKPTARAQIGEFCIRAMPSPRPRTREDVR